MIFFSTLLEGLILIFVFKNVGERFVTKNYHPVCVLVLLARSLQNLKGSTYWPSWKKWFYLWYQVIFFTVDYLTVVANNTSKAIIWLVLLDVDHFMYQRHLTGFNMLLFTKLSFMEFIVSFFISNSFML